MGSSKAAVARDAAAAMCPDARLVAYIGDVIADARFGLRFFRKFDLVFNALDNLTARKHVNAMCARIQLPLFEAGTEGHKGQASIIIRGATECYECHPKSVAKTYAVCTIRSTPDKPVHCMVWAKELHKLLVGDEKESTLWDGAGAAEAGSTESTYIGVVFPRPGPGSSAAEVHAYCRAVFTAVFHADIARRLEAKDAYMTAKVRPRALDLAAIEREGGAGSGAAAGEQDVPTLQQAAAGFISALVSFYSDAETRARVGSIAFDKDSDLDLALVASAGALRSFTFGIEVKSKWDTKSIVGNIIPAIASSNAIVAGLQVIEAIKLLRGGEGEVLKTGRETYLQGRGHAGSTRTTLMPLKLKKPISMCSICGPLYVTLQADEGAMTLASLVDLLRSELGFVHPEVDNGTGLLFASSQDEEEEDREGVRVLDKALAKQAGGGIIDGCLLSVREFAPDLTNSLFVNVEHVAGSAGMFTGDVAAAKAGAKGAAAAFAACEAKRAQAEAEAEVAKLAKRAKVLAEYSASAREDEAGTVLIDDSEEEGQPRKRARTGEAPPPAIGDDVMEIE